MVDLSIVIVSYNTRELTKQSLATVKKSLSTFSGSWEIVVIDNGSTDGSEKMIREMCKSDTNMMYISNDTNVGFGRANNIGVEASHGRYILLLNTDVIADDIDFDDVIAYMNTNPSIGVLTIRVELQDGTIDPASHRGFPTIWRSFCFFSGLEKLFGKLPILANIFGGYHLTYLDLNSTHEIDVPAGAFFLTRRDIFREVNGFDEDFFMYGEDVDLAYRIKLKGYNIIYYPKSTVIHLKHQSGLKKANSIQRRETAKHFYEAMRIFYDKHYSQKHSPIVNTVIRWAIKTKASL